MAKAKEFSLFDPEILGPGVMIVTFEFGRACHQGPPRRQPRGVVFFEISLAARRGLQGL